MAVKERASERIALKATPSVKSLIDRGAAVAHQSRTEFILSASITAAEELLMNRTSFPLSDGELEQFNQLIEQGNADNKGFQKLMGTPSVWG